LLTNYLLWGTIGFLILIGAGIIFFYRRTSKRDKLLLKTKEELMVCFGRAKEIERATTPQ
jgi:cytochrome c-type biogenesis protein CcmH/NrfF